MVFGGGTEHGGAADVDVLDGRGLFKAIEIDADEVDGKKAHLGAGFPVRGIPAALENAAVDLGMEG